MSYWQSTDLTPAYHHSYLLFPAPVRPQTPIFSPPWIVRFSPFSTSGRPGRYASCAFFTSMAPLVGQSAGGRTSVTSGASSGSLRKETSRSTAVKLFST